MTDYLSKSPLGKKIGFTSTYDPSLLFPVPRGPARIELGLDPDCPPFTGEDVWNCWELSWLGLSGKPEVAVLELRIPATSPFIVESKSLKLYLNSLNMTSFACQAEVQKTIVGDLTKIVGASVRARLFSPESFSSLMPEASQGFCLDSLDWQPGGQGVLRTETVMVSEEIYSNLLRTNCPITGQPDWAALTVRYTGHKISGGSLLDYLVGLREHAGFHESSVEMIFMKIWRECAPEKLAVNARYTRRGGIDISPYRSTGTEIIHHVRDFRQ